MQTMLKSGGRVSTVDLHLLSICWYYYKMARLSNKQAHHVRGHFVFLKFTII